MALKAETREKLAALVEQRIRRNAEQIEHSLHQIAIGNPLGAETEPKRMVARLQIKMQTSKTEAKEKAAEIEAAAASDAEGLTPSAVDGREAIWGQTLDFLDVSFLDLGAAAANAVARIAFNDGRAQGSGLLVAPGLLITNHHVIESQAAAAEFCAQFRFEKKPTSRGKPATFALDPSACFVTDDIDGLDFTLIGIGRRLNGADSIESFGYLPLSDAPDKHMLGEVANIIQHPRGRYKELVLRENQLVARDELARVLHYIADTEPGSSGSPVFNNDWEVIALHHWGGPWLEAHDAEGPRREINEGIRISEIVKFLRRSASRFDGRTAASVSDALRLWDQGARPRPATVAVLSSGGGEGMGPEARKAVVEDFSDRGGYEPGFLHGYSIQLPALASDHTPARNLKALIGEDPYELRYHHFSLVMNATRRLAYFTACNIDGSRPVAINRQNKTTIENPTLDDLGVESAEASDDFRPDPRVDPDEQMARPFYEAQRVPGYPDPQDKGRIARMFQKGHIIMRGDPAWGVPEEALRAERDTFFYTNAAPQVGFFNQGSDINRPGSKGKLRWRAVETYVLRNAVTQRSRVTVFAGPIFADDDPIYRFDAQVPMRFWKIACWVDDVGDLNSIALIADQSTVLKVMPERLAEAFLDEDELERVDEFLSTVAYIEQETGLDFGADVRNADVRKGASANESVKDAKASVLKPAKKAPPKAVKKAPAKKAKKAQTKKSSAKKTARKKKA